MRPLRLYQLDGKIPNIALMRIAAHYRRLGHEIDLVVAMTPEEIEPKLWHDPDADIFGSLIFEKTRPLARRFLGVYPRAAVGGTGWDIASSLEAIGIDTDEQDYSVYPSYRQSIGFTQRGCRLKCPFCVVPKKEGKVRAISTISEIWRGEPWPRELLLLDNDFFGQEQWRERIDEIRSGGFKVSFNQGINVRFLTEETAKAVASVNYRDDGMKSRRVYTAWDTRGDEKRVVKGLRLLFDAGVKPYHVMVYMLIGYWPKETQEDWEHRRKTLRRLGCLPYPMPYHRTPATVGFQRFVVGAYDRRGVSWPAFVQAGYQPKALST